MRSYAKLNKTELYDIAYRHLRELREVEVQEKKQLEAAPYGKIHIVRSRNNIQYYLRTSARDKSGRYISRKNEKQLYDYLQKSYCEKVLKVISKEIHIIEEFLEKSDGIVGQIEEIYNAYPDKTREYIKPIMLSDEEYAQEWSRYEYVGKTLSDNAVVLQTQRGVKVRSKSELNIANALEKAGIPYRYECPLQLGDGGVIYPDFMVLNKRTRTVYYWEHRGMMDDRDYSRHTVKRIKDLGKCGIILGKNLIITEECSNIPLGTDEIERIINTYLV